MLALSLGASAIHPAANTVAPFKGTVYLSLGFGALGGCASAKVSTKSFFSLHTGKGGFAGVVSARTCGSGYNTDSGDVSSGFHAYLDAPFHRGPTTVYLNGTFAMKGTLRDVPGKCTIYATSNFAACESSAEVYVYGYAYWQDLTTGSQAFMGQLGGSAFYLVDNSTFCETSWNGTSFSNSSSGTPGPISASGAFSVAYTLTTTMVKTHQYVVFVELVEYTDAQVSYSHNGGFLSYSGASASSMVNFASGGNGITIASISES